MRESWVFVRQVCMICWSQSCTKMYWYNINFMILKFYCKINLDWLGLSKSMNSSCWLLNYWLLYFKTYQRIFDQSLLQLWLQIFIVNFNKSSWMRCERYSWSINLFRKFWINTCTTHLIWGLNCVLNNSIIK